HKILFAVADDEALAGAIPVVAACARKWGAEVRVLHVHEIQPNAPRAFSRRLVRSVVERLESEGVVAEGEVQVAEPGEKVGSIVARTAEQAGASLVAIGSHGRSGLGALFLGSVSDDAAGGLEVPVLVVRAGCTTPAVPRTVLVGVDGSAASD